MHQRLGACWRLFSAFTSFLPPHSPVHLHLPLLHASHHVWGIYVRYEVYSLRTGSLTCYSIQTTTKETWAQEAGRHLAGGLLAHGGLNSNTSCSSRETTVEAETQSRWWWQGQMVRSGTLSTQEKSILYCELKLGTGNGENSRMEPERIILSSVTGSRLPPTPIPVRDLHDCYGCVLRLRGQSCMCATQHIPSRSTMSQTRITRILKMNIRVFSKVCSPHAQISQY